MNYQEKESLLLEKEKNNAKKLYEKRKSKIIRNRGWNKFISVLWVIFGGLYNSIIMIALGISYCVTLIGIPFGIVYFKSIGLIFTPVNKRVVTHYGSHPFLNTIWLLAGGLLIKFLFFIIARLLEITIIFQPMAIQLYKFSTYFGAPFGAKILHKYEFETEEEKQIIYTYQYIKRNNINFLQAETEERKLYLFPEGRFNFKKRIIPDIILMVIAFCFSLFFVRITDHFSAPDVYLGYEKYLYIFVNIILKLVLISIPSIVIDRIKRAIYWRGLWYGYINVSEILLQIYNPIYVYIRVFHSSNIVKEKCLLFYNQNKEIVNEFIKQEYIY